MNNRNYMLAALTGILFLVLAMVSTFVMGEPPDPKDDSVQEIVNFYTDNESEIWAATIMQMIATVALVFYGGYLRRLLRVAEGEGRMLSSVALAGITIVAVAIGVDATINVALVEEVDDIDPAAAQALSALWSNDFIPLAIGASVFMLAVGLSIVRHGALPKWLGWVAILFGVIGVTPARLHRLPRSRPLDRRYEHHARPARAVRRRAWCARRAGCAGSALTLIRRRTGGGHAPSPVVSRGGRIRTGDLVLPKHARYQPAPRPVLESVRAPLAADHPVLCGRWPTSSRCARSTTTSARWGRSIASPRRHTTSSTPICARTSPVAARTTWCP